MRLNIVSESNKINTKNLLISFYEEDNTDSLNLFFQINKLFLFHSAYYLLNQTLAAEEAVKKTFLIILKRAAICPTSIIQDEEKIKTWLLNITLRTAREIAKSGNYKSNNAIHQKNFSHKENLKQKLILEELFQLPEKLKLPLMLHYREKISNLEISYLYQTNQTQIKSYIQSTLDQLKILLKNSGLILTGDLICREIQIIKLPEYSQEFDRQMNFEFLSNLNLIMPEIKSQPSSNLPYFHLLSGIALAIPILLGLYLLYDEFSTKAENPTPKPIIQTKTISIPVITENKKSWDFAKDNSQDFIVMKGFWTHDPIHGLMKTNYNTTTLVQTPFEFNSQDKPLILHFKSYIFNPFANREITSRLGGYLFYGKKNVKYKFISHVSQLNKNHIKLLNGVAIDYSVKLIVHPKGIFVLDPNNQFISSMLFTEPIPPGCKVVIAFDNIYTKNISLESNGILSPEILTKIIEKSEAINETSIIREVKP